MPGLLCHWDASFLSQVYQDLAETDKQRYIKEYLAYQETDVCKQFMRNKHPGLNKKAKLSEKGSKKKEKQVKVSSAS
jgi:hypothetical protein